MSEAHRTEGPSWTNDAWSFEQVLSGLESFEVKLSAGSLRNLFVELGISPARRFKREGVRRGLFGFYDPLVCWVLAVAKHRASGSLEDMACKLDRYREVAEKAVWGDVAHEGSEREESDALEWGWRAESVAYHLFISDIDHGVDIRTVRRWLKASPEVITYTLDSDRCLEAVLRSYAAKVIAAATGVKAKPEEICFFEGDKATLHTGRFPSTDTLEILDSFGFLKARKEPWRGPTHSIVKLGDAEDEGGHWRGLHDPDLWKPAK